MTIENARENVRQAMARSKNNVESLNTKSTFCAGALIIVGALMLIIPNAITALMWWSYTTWASLKWIPNATLNSWTEGIYKTAILAITVFSLPVAICIIAVGLGILLYVARSHTSRIEKQAN